jgi:cell division protein FtsL
MAKIVTKKRRRLSMNGFALVLFTFSLFAWLATSLLVNTVNNNLTMKIQSMNEELATLRSENQVLSYEINNLENKDRIYAVAEAANMNQVTDNIISVAGE